MSKNKTEVNNAEKGFMGASDIVNGTAPLYRIPEKEVESALEDIYEEIGINDEEE